MSIIAIEGVVDHGQIRLKNDISLPDNTKVYVIVPDYQATVTERAHVYSPRLAHSEQMTDFRMEIIEDQPDASL